MSKNILAEAIADANMVKKMAVAHAKQQIEEAFTPHLSKMISDRLLNEDNDASSEIAGKSVTVDNPGPKEPSAAASDSSHVENPGLEVDTFDDPAKALSGKAVNEDQFPTDEDPAMDASMGGPPMDAPVEEPAMDFGAEGGEPDELDLDAIIRELELDLQGGDDMAEPQFDDPAAAAAPPMEDPARVESFDQAMAGKEVDGAFDGALKEDAEGVFTDGKSPTPVDGVNGGKKVQPGQEVTATSAEAMKEEITLDEILREMAAEEVKAESRSHVIVAENVKLKQDIKEAYQVVQYLRGKLLEVNMLNSKLLFTNKLFKAYDLKLEQKMRIVETFDRATTLREVKLVYATLAEALKGGSSFGGSKKTAKSITEGFASKPTPSTAPKSPTVLAEGADLANRFKKLAGIK